MASRDIMEDAWLPNGASGPSLKRNMTGSSHHTAHKVHAVPMACQEMAWTARGVHLAPAIMGKSTRPDQTIMTSCLKVRSEKCQHVFQQARMTCTRCSKYHFLQPPAHIAKSKSYLSRVGAVLAAVLAARCSSSEILP